MSEITAKAKGILYHPYTISIHITDICNNRCIFCCEASHEHSLDLIRKEEIIQYLESQDTSKWTELNIHGGEPTLSPALIEVIQIAKKRGYRHIILQTNAHRIGVDKEFAKNLDASGVDLYNIGFHGSNCEIMDPLTGLQGSFEKVMKGIKRIVGFHKPIRITSVVSAMNYKDISSIVKLAANEGISHVNISSMQTAGSAVNNIEKLFISYSEAKPYIIDAINLAKSLNLQVTLESFPFCVLKGFEEYQVDWTIQHLKMLHGKIIMNDYNSFLAEATCTYASQCETCSKHDVCSGVYKEYVNIQGWSEFQPYK